MLCLVHACVCESICGFCGRTLKVVNIKTMFGCVCKVWKHIIDGDKWFSFWTSEMILCSLKKIGILHVYSSFRWEEATCFEMCGLWGHVISGAGVCHDSYHCWILAVSLVDSLTIFGLVSVSVTGLNVCHSFGYQIIKWFFFYTVEPLI